MSISSDSKVLTDMQHFQEMITPFYDHLYKFIYCIVHNKSLADDIFQTTLINGYSHFGDLCNVNSFKSWIFSIAKNEAISTLKKYRREISIDSVDYDALIDDDNFFPEEYLINYEIKGAVIDAINSLNAEDREIIILRYYTGLKFEEISEILNMNFNTIRTRHRAIKNKLYKYLKKHEFI